MILNFRHRGLRQLYERDDPRGVHPEHVGKLQNILARLKVALGSEDMNLPGFRCIRSREIEQDHGPLQCGQIGALPSALKGQMWPMYIMKIITKCSISELR